MKMKLKILALVAAVAATVLLIAAPASASGVRTGFGFNATGISGVDATGVVTLTGGGAYNNSGVGFAKSGGGFRCTADVALGPLGGCLAGEGVRWDTAGLLRSTSFRCIAGETLQTATTGRDTVVLLADFYRAGDGNDESFTAQMIVSDTDIDPATLGVQNVWIQGVGCASAIVNFSS